MTDHTWEDPQWSPTTLHRVQYKWKQPPAKSWLFLIKNCFKKLMVEARELKELREITDACPPCGLSQDMIQDIT